jgi:pilus assembly protein CpaE
LPKSGSGDSKIILFSGAKGGSGCSFISNSIAAYFAKSKKENVLLLDLNIGKKDSRIIFDIIDENNRDIGDIENVINDIDLSILKKLVVNFESSLNLILPPLRTEKKRLLNGKNLGLLFDSLKENFDIICVDFPYYLFFEDDFDFGEYVDKLIFISLPDLISINNLDLLSKNLCFDYIAHKIEIIINKFNSRPAIPPSRLANTLKFPVKSFIPYDRDVEFLYLNKGPVSIFNYNLRIVKAMADFSEILYESLNLKP